MPGPSFSDVARDLGRLGPAVNAQAARTVGRFGMMLRADVKRRAARSRTHPSVAGLPPRLQTGDYNRSIGMAPARPNYGGTRHWASVGTNKEQGRRLEHGYSAPGQRTLPHPHFGPSLDKIEQPFTTAIRVLANPTGKRSR